MDFSFKINENFRFNFDGFFQKSDEKNLVPVKDSVLVFGGISGKIGVAEFIGEEEND